MGFIKWPGKISVRIGPLIKSDGKTAASIIDQTETWIEAEMANITNVNRFPY